MLSEKERALLGDREAQERLTAEGVLLPCWRCGGKAEVETLNTVGKPIYAVVCERHYCGAYGAARHTKQKAIEEWNTRAPILSAEEVEMLHGKENT